MKRAFDVVFAATALICAAPVLGIVALLVRLTSTGPVVFRQVRVGLGGRPFRLYKFRSMYEDAPAYALTPTQDDDPRITPIGRFLRASSIDELPQLWNVLRGDMSVVGPRPEMPFIVAEYSRTQRGRLAAKPGLTGLWQISPHRLEPIHENLQYDFYYIENASLLLDLNIIARTASLVVRESFTALGRVYARVTAPAGKPAPQEPQVASAAFLAAAGRAGGGNGHARQPGGHATRPVMVPLRDD